MNLEGLVVSKIFWILTANLLKRLHNTIDTLYLEIIQVSSFLGSR